MDPVNAPPRRGAIFMRAFRGTATAVAALMVGGVGVAHHSAIMFDSGKCQSVSGAIRNFEWMNPHSWVWITVPNSSGGSDIWGFEIPAPSQLVALDSRWSNSALPKGNKVTVSYSPLKDGRRGGLANAITRADGSVLHGAPNALRCETINWPRKPAAVPPSKSAAPK
jgi:hypothetical protein